MKTIETTAKRWGNSIGIIIPKEVIDKEHIKENGIVRFLIIKESDRILRETFGLAKDKIKKTAQQIKNEIRNELYD